MTRTDSWGPIKARERDPGRTVVYALPTEIVFGSGEVGTLGRRLAEMGLRRPLVVTDKGLRSAGIVDRVLDSLSGSGLRPAVFDDVLSDPTTSVVEEASDVLRRGDHDSVIGLGGGSPIDAAKAAGALRTNPGCAIDYVGRDRLEADPLPIVAVPTTAGTGSEVTMWSVLTDPESGNKVSIGSMRIMPRLALLDPDLTLGLPPAITAATGMDALTHAMESYASVWSHPIAEGLAIHAVELVGGHLRRAVADGTDREARAAMLMASLIAELAANSTRLGLSHALAVPLGARHHVPHGLANAILLPHVVDFNAAADPDRYARMASLLGPDGVGDAVNSLNRDIGIDERLSDWGVGEEDLPVLAQLALRSDNVQANPREAGETELVAILRAAL